MTRFKIVRWGHANFEQHLLGIVQGFGELLDGLVTVLSLGFLCSNFEGTVSWFRAKRYIVYLKRNRSNEKDTLSQVEVPAGSGGERQP